MRNWYLNSTSANHADRAIVLNSQSETTRPALRRIAAIVVTAGQEPVMSALTPSLWLDYKLLAIIDDTGIWVAHGRQGSILYRTNSLRTALEQSAKFVRSGVLVGRLARQPSDSIVVDYDQMLKIKKLLAGLEVPAIRESATAR